MNSRPLIKWLKEKGEEFLPTNVGYVDNQDHYYQYYKHNVDAKIFQKELEKKANPLEAVIEIDPKTRQNLFHFLLSGDIFFINQLILDEYAILESDWKRAHDEVSIAIKPSAYVDVTQANHEKLISRKIAKKIKVLIVEQVSEILNTALAVFSNREVDNEKLFHALIHSDNKKNTPLHHAFKRNLVQSCGTLLRRIQSMPMQFKRELLEAEDQLGKTILHYAAEYTSGKQLQEVLDIFGLENFKHTFNLVDSENNSALHKACLTSSSQDRKAKIEILCLLLKSTIQKNVGEEQKQVYVSSDTVFLQNVDGKNPLHIACQVRSAENKQEAETIHILKHALSEKYLLKLIEQDNLGNTPLHYAIQSGCVERVKELLTNVEEKAKEQLILMTNKKNQSALHAALEGGNPQILKIIMNAISHINLHELHCSPSVTKLLAKSKLKEDYLNYIHGNNATFLLMKYFLDQPKRFTDKKDENFVARIADARNCFSAIESKQELPLEDPSFFPHKRVYGLFGTSSGRYHQLRRALKKASVEEFNECKEYFRVQAQLTVTQKNIIEFVLKDANLNDQYEPVQLDHQALIPQYVNIAPISYVSEPPVSLQVEKTDNNRFYPQLIENSPGVVSNVGFFPAEPIQEVKEDVPPKLPKKTQKVAVVC